MDELILKLTDWGCDIPPTLERFLNNKEFMIECMKMVLDDKALIELEDGLKEENIKKAFDAAHTLKGIYANTGVIPLYDIAVKIVEPLRNGEIKGLDEYYQELMCKNKELTDILL